MFSIRKTKFGKQKWVLLQSLSSLYAFIFLFTLKLSLMFQLFRFVEQAEWATEVMKATGKPVAVCLSVSLAGDMNGVPPGECAVRVARAGTFVRNPNSSPGPSS